MTRPTVTVTVTSDVEPDAPPVHEETRGAFNAAVRAGEAFVREAARTAGVTFTGDAPHRTRTATFGPAAVGDTYTRVGRADDGSDVLRVTVERTS
jgi:hypothetical protein